MRSRFSSRARIAASMLIATAAVAALGAMRDNHIVTEMAWSNYRDGLAEARLSRKPILITLQAPGEGRSIKMDTETFTDPGVLLLAQEFVCVRADRDTDHDAARRYRVRDYPTTVIARPDGTPISIYSGFIPSARFIGILKGVSR